VEKGGKKGGIAKKYGISPSTLSTFLKQKSKINRILMPMPLAHSERR